MVDQDSTPQAPPTDGLRNRHIAMIALGGTIGAGLFVGSGAAIPSTWPAVLLAFLSFGILVFLVFLLLVELVVASPARGSFLVSLSLLLLS